MVRCRRCFHEVFKLSNHKAESLSDISISGMPNVLKFERSSVILFADVQDWLVGTFFIQGASGQVHERTGGFRRHLLTKLTSGTLQDQFFDFGVHFRPPNMTSDCVQPGAPQSY